MADFSRFSVYQELLRCYLAIICDCNFPTVLNICNFHGYDTILEEFTQNMANYFKDNNSSSATPRLVIFWTDKSPPCFNLPSNDFLVNLDPLNEISMQDITQWVDNHQEKHKILTEYGGILKGLLLNWQNPQGVLHEICNTFKVPNGITTIKNNWDLSL